jgi:carbon-monoxide dehydrogenase small subunit
VSEDYQLCVDGRGHEVACEEDGATLVSVLRDRLGLHGTKVGCATGRCGTCSVLLDGVHVTSCTVLAADAVGSEVTTVAGLGTTEHPGPVQEALVRFGAVQCGFCTPGMVVAITALLRHDPSPDESEVRLALSGNLCRCTGYGRIVEAVLSLAEP